MLSLTRPRPRDGIPSLDPKVIKAEENYTKGLSASGVPDLGGLSIGPQFPRRPGFGTQGNKVILWANYFELVPPPDLELYLYTIKCITDGKKDNKGNDQEPAGKKLKQVIKLLLEQPPLQALGNDIVSNFKDMIISRVELTKEQIDALPSTIQYRAEHEDEPKPRDPVYRYNFAAGGKVTISELTEYLTSTNANVTFDKAPITQALNIFLGHFTKKSGQHATIGANKSYRLDQSAASAGNLGAGLTALRGFFSSVRVATARILVNVNVTHAPFYNHGPLRSTMDDFANQHGPNRVKLQAFLKSVRVKTTHLPEKKSKNGITIPRVKTISALATVGDGPSLEHPPRIRGFGATAKEVEFWFNPTSASSKPGATPPQPAAKAGGKKQGKGKGKQPSLPEASTGGGYISVYDFFQKTYNMKVAERYPVVNVGNKANPSYLPVDVCTIMPGQSFQSKLDPNQTAEMIRVAVRPPFVNAKSIAEDSTGTLGLSSQLNIQMRQYGISVAPKMITVPGRVLNNPQIKYNGKAPKMFPASWNQQDMNRQYLKFNAGGKMGTWGAMMITIPGQPVAFQSSAALNSTVAAFHKAMNDLGIQAPPPQAAQRVGLQDIDDPRLEDSLTASNQPSFLLIILPVKSAPLYNRIKRIGDIKAGIHTVCVVGDKFIKEKGQDKYFANVLLKVNLKLGGTNQAIDSNRLGVISEDKTMVVGLDVTHPSPGSTGNAPSVAGMVASIDKNLGQWPAILRIQKEARQEMVTELNEMLKSRLRLWQTKGKHAQLPENILIYRDGVSEGQYDLVLNSELPLLRKACEEVYPATAKKQGFPRMTIIVVGKRHHTRFYPTVLQKGISDDGGNCVNGTIVDRGVTEARNWDFFLQAHTALQGTARPAHYFIVLDEIFTKRTVPAPFKSRADVLEDLTHNMCYLFGRACKAVSLCPPAYYADLVCERARCYLARHFDETTPAASESEGSGPSKAVNSDVTLHAKLQDTMFYI